MSKRMTRVLSLILTLVMFVSVSTPAFAWGGGDLGSGWDRDIGEDEIRDFVPEEEIVEEEEPLDFFQTDGADGRQVTVEAPMGALPTLAELRAELVEVEDVREAVESVVEGEANILLAMDISFWMNGIEIEPEEPVRVKISAPELDGKSNLTLVHIPDAAEPEKVELIDEEDLSFALGTNEIAFQADSFSVYAVVGEGETGDEARATVEFYGLNDAKVATYYVKNSDQLPPDDPDDRQDNVQYLDQIVVDPGVGGQVPEGQIFVGWYIGETKDFTTKTEPMTIDKVRVALDGMTVKEGQVIKVWAMIFKVFSVSYMITDSVSIGVDEIYLLPDETSVEYAVSKDYTPEDPTQNFLGWITDNDSAITNAKYNGEDAAEPYKLSTTMTISGSIVFRISAPHGRWLVFDENGSGATYNAPQFVEDGQVTHEPPLDMVRLGYTFKGWYTVKYADNETADESNKFNFGGELSDPSKTIYAKWEVNPTAPYTVIYWKQNVSGNGYDFDKSESATAAPGTVIDVNAAGTTISVTGVADYSVATGFSYEKHDEGKAVAPEGNTVVNVYIKRNEYTLTFKSGNSNFDIQYKTISNYELVRVTDSGSDLYAIKIDGKWYEITRYGSYVWNTSEIASVPTPGDGYIRYRYGSGYDEDAPVSGTEYTIPTDPSVIKTITALYGQSIADEFPIDEDDYPTGTRWMPQSAFSAVIDGETVVFFRENVVVAYIDAMPPTNMTLTYNPDPTREGYAKRTMNYWLEAPSGTEDDPNDPNTQTYKNKVYELHKSVVAVYYGVTIEDYIDFVGFEHFEADKPLRGSGSSQYYYNSTNSSTRATEVNFYYSRKVYTLLFTDGLYFNGNGVAFSTDEYAPLGTLREVNEVVFGSDISSYNKDGSTYYVPTTNHPGFVFEGWYIDDACTEPYTFTTMPEGGIQVYAKWRQIQYRVFLHANAKLPTGENDPSLSWGSATQEMNFRVSYMGKVADVTGTRGDEYKFIGWFTSDGKPFNTDSALTEANVTQNYDKTKDFTDPMDPYGDVPEEGAWNSDLTGWDHDNDKSTPGIDRYWITKKLVLTAKWSALLPGAEGITIVYDANGGTNAPIESKKYQDNVDALAGTAPTPPQDYRFLYWVVQKWDGTAFVDTSTIVYPGAPFTVLKSLSQETNLSVDDPEYQEGKVTKAYTMHLRAQYGPAEITKDTHIDWYINVEGTTAPIHEDKDLQINQAVDIFTLTDGIPTRVGYKFLGWARETQYETDDAGNFTDQTIPYYPDLTESDLYLKWIPASGEGDEAVKGHYELADGSAVTQVAADERKPYQAFYAVWEYVGVFYVFHSSDASVDLVDMAAMTTETYDLTAAVKGEGKYLYGGYYKQYLNLGVENAEVIAAAEAGKPVSVAKYDGSSSKDGDVAFWASANAFTTVVDETLGGGRGTAMTPKDGQVYYLKEVPANLYLRPYFRYTYHLPSEGQTNNGEFGNAWTFLVVDDTYYKEAGFIIVKDAMTAKICKTVTIKTAVGGNTETLTHEIVSPGSSDGSRLGYLEVYNNTKADEDQVLTNGDSVFQYWKTKDGVFVTGILGRTYNGVGSANTIECTPVEIVSLVGDSIDAVIAKLP